MTINLQPPSSNFICLCLFLLAVQLGTTAVSAGEENLPPENHVRFPRATGEGMTPCPDDNQRACGALNCGSPGCFQMAAKDGNSKKGTPYCRCTIPALDPQISDGNKCEKSEYKNQEAPEDPENVSPDSCAYNCNQVTASDGDPPTTYTAIYCAAVAHATKTPVPTCACLPIKPDARTGSGSGSEAAVVTGKKENEGVVPGALGLVLVALVDGLVISVKATVTGIGFLLPGLGIGLTAAVKALIIGLKALVGGINVVA